MHVRSSASDFAFCSRQLQHRHQFLSISVCAKNLLLLVQTVCYCVIVRELEVTIALRISKSFFWPTCTLVFIKKKSLCRSKEYVSGICPDQLGKCCSMQLLFSLDTWSFAVSLVHTITSANK